ncbi:MAG TPA: hypothetical protein VK617_10590 [Gemmatimonadaceae bacterium]|nr:hypothetical protein [Gemmatimonadaceae bacterium]
MMSLLKSLEHFLAPWQSAYSDSKVISTFVVGAHVLAMFIGGGFAIAADRKTLQALRADAVERTRQLFELHQIHRPVLVSMAVMLVTGVMLAASDVKTFATAPMFWIKIALVGSLIVNGGVLTKTEESLRNGGMVADVAQRRWGRLRTVSWMSLVLWSATLIVGVILQNAT